MEKTYANHLGKAVTKSEVFSLLEKKGSYEKYLLQSASQSITVCVRALQRIRASRMYINTEKDLS